MVKYPCPDSSFDTLVINIVLTLATASSSRYSNKSIYRQDVPGLALEFCGADVGKLSGESLRGSSAQILGRDVQQPGIPLRSDEYATMSLDTSKGHGHTTRHTACLHLILGSHKGAVAETMCSWG